MQTKSDGISNERDASLKSTFLPIGMEVILVIDVLTSFVASLALLIPVVVYLAPITGYLVYFCSLAGYAVVIVYPFLISVLAAQTASGLRRSRNALLILIIGAEVLNVLASFLMPVYALAAENADLDRIKMLAAARIVGGILAIGANVWFLVYSRRARQLFNQPIIG